MTPLSAIDVPDYLLARGLVSTRSIVDSDLVVHELSGRNRTFVAECTNAASYVLKQGATPEGTAAAHEGEAYRALSATRSMGPHLPQFHGYDADARVLVVEYLRDAEDLANYHRHRRRPPIRTASAVGAILADLHELPVAQTGQVGYRRQRPSVLSLHRPGPRMLAESSRVTLDLIRIIQGTNGFGFHLDELNADWSATNLIHQDVRFKNFVRTTSSRGIDRPRLKLIDWELACLGDPRWDIGSALGDYMSLWLTSIPVTGSAPTEQSAELARCPLDGIQPAIRACWDVYVKRRRLGVSADALLPVVVRFAAARLVQTALEIAQDSANLTTDIVLHLQAAYNVFERPGVAAAHMFGLTSDTIGRVGGEKR